MFYDSLNDFDGLTPLEIENKIEKELRCLEFEEISESITSLFHLLKTTGISFDISHSILKSIRSQYKLNCRTLCQTENKSYKDAVFINVDILTNLRSFLTLPPKFHLFIPSFIVDISKITLENVKGWKKDEFMPTKLLEENQKLLAVLGNFLKCVSIKGDEEEVRELIAFLKEVRSMAECYDIWKIEFELWKVFLKTLIRISTYSNLSDCGISSVISFLTDKCLFTLEEGISSKDDTRITTCNLYLRLLAKLCCFASPNYRELCEFLAKMWQKAPNLEPSYEKCIKDGAMVLNTALASNEEFAQHFLMDTKKKPTLQSFLCIFQSLLATNPETLALWFEENDGFGVFFAILRANQEILLLRADIYDEIVSILASLVAVSSIQTYKRFRNLLISLLLERNPLLSLLALDLRRVLFRIRPETHPASNHKFPSKYPAPEYLFWDKATKPSKEDLYSLKSALKSGAVALKSALFEDDLTAALRFDPGPDCNSLDSITDVFMKLDPDFSNGDYEEIYHIFCSLSVAQSRRSSPEAFLRLVAKFVDGSTDCKLHAARFLLELSRKGRCQSSEIPRIFQRLLSDENELVFEAAMEAFAVYSWCEKTKKEYITRSVPKAFVKKVARHLQGNLMGEMDEISLLVVGSMEEFHLKCICWKASEQRLDEILNGLEEGMKALKEKGDTLNDAQMERLKEIIISMNNLSDRVKCI